MGTIRQEIPTGFNRHKTKIDIRLLPHIDTSDCPIVGQEFERARFQLGILGGGNHFIDILKDERDNIWILIHSGSRNLGKTVAEYYNNVAINQCKNTKFKHLIKQELCPLNIDSDEGRTYIKEMNYCVEFAYKNRENMINKVMDIIRNVMPTKVEFSDITNIAHNYASLENHYNENVWIHRKGATKAEKDLIGIIPGTQGTNSYIVKGKGNKLSYNSCSHGAGRVMSRTKAIKTINYQKEIDKLDKLGILHGIRGKNSLDEAPSAYKDIDLVMKNQSDLVEIVRTLTPIGVIMGN